MLSGVCAMKNGAIDFITAPVDYRRLLQSWVLLRTPTRFIAAA